MKKIKKMLLVIDLQKDFINSNTKSLLKKIEKLINSKTYENIVFTQFKNTKNSIYSNKLNFMGCITKIGKSIAVDTKKYPVIEKEMYTCLSNQLINYLNDKKIEQIHICGIDTECCILKTAFDLFENNYDVKVLEKYCACTHGKRRHNAAIKILKRNIGEDNIIT